MAKIVTVERHLGAGPEQVFDAWVDPGQAGQWLFRTPDGTLERCEIDPRVGGGFRIDERRGGAIAEHHGEYVALQRPARLAFDFWTSFSEERSRVTVDIAQDGAGSRLTLTHDGVWDDWVDKTRQGWATILEALDRVLNENALS